MPQIERFRLTEAHLKLLRHAKVSWNAGEFGAPSIDCKRPYGNSDVLEDIGLILDVGHDEDDDFSEGLCELLRRLHAETETALQIVLATGAFEEGWYETDEYGDWKATASA